MVARRQSSDPLERYYSRPEFVRPLATWLRMVAQLKVPSTPRGRTVSRDLLNPSGPRVLAVEPCVGHGGLVLGAERAGIRAFWRTIDIDPNARAANFCGDWMAAVVLWRRRSKHHITARRYISEVDAIRLVVTNPPFSRAMEVVRTAWDRHPNAVVAILQRQTWYEPTQDRVGFFRRHPPDVITIGRCSFLGVNGRPVGAGSDHASYAWFVWGPEPERVGLGGGMARVIPWRSVKGSVPALCRVDDGVPRPVDRLSPQRRLGLLGNAVVPQAATAALQTLSARLWPEKRRK